MQTIKIRTLINQLLEFDLDEPVFIELCPNGKPNGCAGILGTSDYGTGGGDLEYGIYIIPHENLADVDKE